MRVLLDTNILLDFLLQREPFCRDANLLFQAIDEGKIAAYVTATTLTDIFYIARKHTGSIEKARQSISLIMTVMAICPVNRAVLESAFNSQNDDFEDAVQISSAIAQGLEYILTRDQKGFGNVPIPVLSIQDCLAQTTMKNGS